MTEIVEGVVVHILVQQGDAASHTVVALVEYGIVAFDEAEEIGDEILSPGVFQFLRQQFFVDGECHVDHPFLVFERKFFIEPEVVDGDVGERLDHLGAVRHGMVVFGEELHHALVEPPLFFRERHEPLVFCRDFVFDIGVAQIDL